MSVLHNASFIGKTLLIMALVFISVIPQSEIYGYIKCYIEDGEIRCSLKNFVFINTSDQDLSSGWHTLFFELNGTNLTIVTIIEQTVRITKLSITYNVSFRIVSFELFLAHLSNENNKSIPKLDTKINITYNNSYACSEPNKSVSTPFGIYINITSENGKRYYGYIGWWMPLHFAINGTLNNTTIEFHKNYEQLIFLVLLFISVIVIVAIVILSKKRSLKDRY